MQHDFKILELQKIEKKKTTEVQNYWLRAKRVGKMLKILMEDERKKE